MRRFIVILVAAALAAVTGCDSDDQEPPDSAATSDVAGDQTEQSESEDVEEPAEQGPELRSLSQAELELALLTQEELGESWILLQIDSEAEGDGFSELFGRSNGGSADVVVEPAGCENHYKSWGDNLESTDEDVLESAEAGFTSEAYLVFSGETIRTLHSKAGEAIAIFRDLLDRCATMTATDQVEQQTATVTATELPIGELGDDSLGVRLAIEVEALTLMSIDAALISRGQHEVIVAIVSLSDNPFDPGELSRLAKAAIDRLDAVLNGELVAEAEPDPDPEVDIPEDVAPDDLTEIERVFLMYINDPASAGMCDNIIADLSELDAEVVRFLEYYLVHNEVGDTVITNPLFYFAKEQIQPYCGLAG